jgi:hypothetical protein
MDTNVTDVMSPSDTKTPRLQRMDTIEEDIQDSPPGLPMTQIIDIQNSGPDLLEE